MTTLMLTRHGETEWNKEGRMQGQLDSKLSKLGEAQAVWLGERLKDTHIDIIISSTSGRAVTTAELIRGDREIEIITKDDLREMHFGCWEGQLHTEVDAKYPEQRHNLWYAPHLYSPIDGEDFQQLIDRTSNEVERIIGQYSGKNILVVCHGIVLKALITYFEKKPIKDLWSGAFMHSTCLNVLEVDGKKRNFTMQGDTSHYKEID